MLGNKQSLWLTKQEVQERVKRVLTVQIVAIEDLLLEVQVVELDVDYSMATKVLEAQTQTHYL